ncbi:MAG: RES family NAD+ phosphorylase [Solirubrobacteraceae bacterium]|nr:RES family NAD+ phosphorylase [Solirubrobacteraceae bacterium]
MTPPIAIATPRGLLHRIGRAPDAWAWPDWAFAGDDATFGNRYDDPAGDYRVLYASSERVGAFVEVLARYRTDPALVAEYAQIATGDDEEHPTIPPGIVPGDWPTRRHVGTAVHPGNFADVGHSDSLAHLRAALTSRLVHFGVDDLDGGELRSRAPRTLTQEISRYVFERGADAGGRSLAGIRYLSRLGDDFENWAMFEGTEPEDATSEPMVNDDVDLVAALAKLDLRLGGRGAGRVPLVNSPPPGGSPSGRR